MIEFIFKSFAGVVFFFIVFTTSAQLRVDTVGYGWAGTSVNTAVFRKNSVVTNGQYQYTAYYDETSHVVLAKRNVGSHSWQVKQTSLTGNTADAHNAISLIVDGNGYLHLAWNHHSQALQYCQSVAPGSLELTPMMSMTGSNEDHVTYPEFYTLNSGDLIFLYRDGLSGEGNLVVNRYSIAAKRWMRVHSNLIDGEHRRNPYWQAYVDSRETIHLSWVWREDWDASTNHDLCYAQSKDGGKTWQKSTGEKYTLPITTETAEYACVIPEKHELINQTSMSADSKGRPYIATYWREEDTDVPQYFIVYHDGKQWHRQQVSNRKTPFVLGGYNTKKIPIARPQLLLKENDGETQALLIYRDEEQGNRVSVLRGVPSKKKWEHLYLTKYSVGSWEPTYDTELWKKHNVLDLFVQHTEQNDGEVSVDIPAQPVLILRWGGW
jgi:hypothetical protein